MILQITKAKSDWIEKNLRRGDKRKIMHLLNKGRPKEEEIHYQVIVSVLNGNLWGKTGEEIIETTTRFLENRLNQEAEEREKYASLLQAS